MTDDQEKTQEEAATSEELHLGGVDPSLLRLVELARSDLVSAQNALEIAARLVLERAGVDASTHMLEIDTLRIIRK